MERIIPCLLLGLAYAKLQSIDNLGATSTKVDSTWLPYETLWFTEDLDHINRDPGTIKIRVLKVNSPNSQPGGPLMVYTGNEGPIDALYNMTGFLTSTSGIPSHWNCNIYFIEHRYYGLSQPSPFTWNYLNTDQVLYDYADIIQQLKPSNSTPVVVFGGSYGGMLSAWMRIKYPHIVDGAIASSAPVLMWLDDGYSYSAKVTSVLDGYGSACKNLIWEGYRFIYELGKRPSLYEAIGDVFNSCQRFTSHGDIEILNNWLETAFAGVVQSNYPGFSDVDAPMPSWPAKATCQYYLDYEKRGVKDTWSLLKTMAESMTVFYNYTGQAGYCYDILGNGISAMSSWDYQTCTELWCPQGSNNKTDVFPPDLWNAQQQKARCSSVYGVTPRPAWVGVNYGMYKNLEPALKYTSNIAFMNGELDPWQYGCVMNTTNPKLYTHTIIGGAHHTDLRAATPEDPADVTASREKEIALISGWIKQKQGREVYQ